MGMATSIPPHNAAELCDAALHLIEKPQAKTRSLLRWVKARGIIAKWMEAHTWVKAVVWVKRVTDDPTRISAWVVADAGLPAGVPEAIGSAFDLRK